MSNLIVGAGLSGLIAAHMFPQAEIIEAASAPVERHKAVLRFRSTAVSDLTGIPFREVTVRKGIYVDGKFVEPTIALANAYSQKCLGRIEGERSIWNLAPVKRYIAPEDFYWQMHDRFVDRISYGTGFDYDRPCISTAPMHVALDALGVPYEGVEFAYKPVVVRRYRVENCDVHQTIYFPGCNSPLYRASITGDLIIAELTAEADESALFWLQQDLKLAFGLGDRRLTPLEQPTKQRYGKIAAIDSGARKALIARLTSEHGVFSLGRFATWRNTLLDDVVADAAVVKRLIHASDYERKLASL